LRTRPVTEGERKKTVMQAEGVKPPFSPAGQVVEIEMFQVAVEKDGDEQGRGVLYVTEGVCSLCLATRQAEK